MLDDPNRFAPFADACDYHRRRLETKFAPDRIAWIRSVLSSYARDLACLVMFGDPDSDETDDTCEILLAGIGLARRIDGSRDEGIAAAKIALAEAAQHANDTARHMRAALWRLARARAPAAQMFAEAEHIAQRHDAYVPRELLIEACAQAVRAVSPMKGGRRNARL